MGGLLGALPEWAFCVPATYSTQSVASGSWGRWGEIMELCGQGRRLVYPRRLLFTRAVWCMLAEPAVKGCTNEGRSCPPQECRGWCRGAV